MTPPNPTEWLAELEAKAKAATRGEWSWKDGGYSLGLSSSTCGPIANIPMNGGLRPLREDQDHIAAADPQTLLVLVAWIELMATGLAGDIAFRLAWEKVHGPTKGEG